MRRLLFESCSFWEYLFFLSGHVNIFLSILHVLYFLTKGIFFFFFSCFLCAESIRRIHVILQFWRILSCHLWMVLLFSFIHSLSDTSIICTLQPIILSTMFLICAIFFQSLHFSVLYSGWNLKHYLPDHKFSRTMSNLEFILSIHILNFKDHIFLKFLMVPFPLHFYFVIIISYSLWMLSLPLSLWG